MDWQLTPRGALIAFGVILLTVTVIYGAALGTAIVGAIIIFGSLYIIYVVFRRVNRRLIYGSQSRDSGGGGD